MGGVFKLTVIIKKTAEEILNNMLNNLPSDYDKTEGGLFYDNLAPISIEFSNFRDIVDYVHKMGFADTSEGIFLEKIAATVGLSRRDAVNSVGEVQIEGEPGTVVEVGTKISSDTFIFETTEKKVIDATKKVIVPAKSVDKGSGCNVGIGAIKYFPVTIQGLTKVTNLKEFKEGYDAETDEELRTRYFIKVREPATSGNVYHYRQWCLAVPGIGGVKVFPLWNGNGTVKLVLMDVNGLTPGAQLLKNVQDYVEEQRPIGATVTYNAAISKIVNFTGKVRIGTETTIEKVNEEFKKKVIEYFRKSAFKDDYLSYAKLGNILLNTTGVKDYLDFKMNNGTTNITLGAEDVPTFGTVKIEVM